MDLSKMNDTDDRTEEEALQDEGKDLELGLPLVGNERTAWWINQLDQEDPTHVDQDMLDSVPPLVWGDDSSISASTNHQTNDRKRKGKEDQLVECEDTDQEAEYEQTCMGKQEGDSSSKKKKASREARTLSERIRRGKITEKFQKLQELIPLTNRVSRASMLDGAITYIKSVKVLLEKLAKMSPENAKVIEQFNSCKSV